MKYQSACAVASTPTIAEHNFFPFAKKLSLCVFIGGAEHLALAAACTRMNLSFIKTDFLVVVFTTKLAISWK